MPLLSPKKKGHLLHASLLVGSMTMTSRVLGLIRDITIATYFGSSSAADAFFIAFRIPNFLRRLFAEGAFAQAFVPVLSEHKTLHTQKDVKKLIDHVTGTLGLILLALTALGIIAAPIIIYIFAPGFYHHTEKLHLATHMLQLTFPYLLLISLTALAGAMMNTYGHFALPAFTPTLLNVSLITVTIWLTPYCTPPVVALAWGVLIAGLLQFGLQIPFLVHYGLLPRPKWGWKTPGVQKILKLMAPALFSVSVSQINLLLDTILASFLQTGSISWLYYSDRLVELPLGVFGVAIGSVILPSLSQQHTQQSTQHFSTTLDWALRTILLIAIPATFALLVLAEPVLSTLFHHGVMTDRDVYMASGSLRAFSLGLTAFMLIKVLAPGYFARQKTKIPVQIAIKALVANMILNLLFIWPLAHVGLALATSLSAMLNAALLYHGLRKEAVFVPQPGWNRFILQLLLASGTMLATLIYLRVSTAQWLTYSAYHQVMQLSTYVIIGLFVYTGSLLLVGLRPKHLHH